MSNQPSAGILALSGFIALAVAMGIGRFAFTPLLPMMQADAGLGLAEGGWLASANYLGYFVGALTAAALPGSPAAVLRVGLLLVVASTALMGMTDGWYGWMAWRFIAGLASAWVLVSTAALCLSRLAVVGRQALAGLVFAGVGTGIALAGLLCMVLAIRGVASAHAWLLLGAIALAGAISARRLWASGPAAAASNAPAATPTGGHGRLIVSYGLFGFGYILPATFLPAQARLLVNDPALFGLAWPIFGLAAAVSTLLITRLAAVYTRRTLWIASHIVMAAGVIVPALAPGLGAIVIAAVCVGGTFMVITMLAMQEAQAVGGSRARHLMAAMTASFAAGQLAGPIFFSLTNTWFGTGLDFALELAAAGLLLGAVLLWPAGTRRATGA